MGKCPNCGNESLILRKRQCINCGKECCAKCGLYVLTALDSGPVHNYISDKWACSDQCRLQFGAQVLAYPLENLGTELGTEFNTIENALFHKACFATMNKADSARKRWEKSERLGIDKALQTIEIQTMSSDQKFDTDLRDKFRAYALRTLASNIEKTGRPLDAAKIYEKELKMYDKARELRERDKQVVVKSTNVSLNLNQLLQQVKDGGIVAVYRCPHCGGKLKVDKSVDISKLKICEHCGSEIEAIDLADFLKTALS